MFFSGTSAVDRGAMLTFLFLHYRNLLGQMKFIYAVVTTFFIWIASIITVIPYGLNLDYNYVNDTCDKNWNSQSSRQGYTISLFLLDYLLPLIALLILYVMVWGKLQR